ncbi:MAG: polysulfide reductase NrfD [Anaerolineae bacterium]|nr:polysulfide reductase NrfD [Anaerolineae bacterium]
MRAPFISAFLLLMRQSWRTAFSRFAEAMTLFALAVAGLFPLFHVGRVELIYYTIPYPNTMNLFSQWRSPLIWDAVAISTYGLVSLLFWYIDLIPDLASMRDKARTRVAKFMYAIPALGWRGDAHHWQGLHRTAFFLAAIATPLVISVHSVVGLDFAISQLPGWHHTIFPPFFVAGAIFSGLAMVMLFAALFRSAYKMQTIITDEHMNKAGILMLITGLLVTYGYLIEIFGAWFSGDTYEWAYSVERVLGPLGWSFWGMMIFNAVVVQLLWFRSVRTNPTAMVLISLAILVGMWLERFVIIPVSLSYPFLENMWDPFTFGIWDILTVISPFGLFLTAMFLFIRFVPVIPIAETQATMIEEAHHVK